MRKERVGETSPLAHERVWTHVELCLHTETPSSLMRFVLVTVSWSAAGRELVFGAVRDPTQSNTVLHATVTSLWGEGSMSQSRQRSMLIAFLVQIFSFDLAGLEVRLFAPTYT